REESRDLMWKKWHKTNKSDLDESDFNYESQTIYYNSMPYEEYENEKDLQEDRNEFLHDDDEETGCKIS
ncbi:MAG: hypothetical protein AAGG81_09230, partial [Chlamydiota bacterium]